MSVFIEDGSGSGFKAKVGSNLHLITSSVSFDPLTHQGVNGDAYSTFLGPVNLTAAGVHGFLYLLNSQDNNAVLIIDRIVVSLGSIAGAAAGSSVVGRVYKNPSTGTLITGGAVLPTPVNRNFGSIKPVSVSGRGWSANNQTVTDGTQLSAVMQPGPSTAVFQDIGWALPQGASLAITLETPAATTGMLASINMSFYFINPDDI